MGSFSSFSVWRLPKASSTEDFGILIYTFGNCVCISFFYIYAHFSETSVGVLSRLRNSASLSPDPIFSRSFLLPETIAGQCYFPHQIKQLALFPIRSRELVGARVKRFNAALSEAVFLLLLCSLQL